MTTLSHTRNIRTGDLSKKNERDSSVYTKNISLKKRGQRDIVFSSSFFERFVSPTILFLLVVSIAVYLYMATSLVFLTVERKALQEKIARETTELSYKQISYSDAIKKIDSKEVYGTTFMESRGGIFATRDVTPVLTYKNN